jgi:hypothetical protein
MVVIGGSFRAASVSNRAPTRPLCSSARFRSVKLWHLLALDLADLATDATRPGNQRRVAAYSPQGREYAFGCVLGVQKCVSTIADPLISDGTKLHQGALTDTLRLHRSLRGGVHMKALMQ